MVSPVKVWRNQKYVGDLLGRQGTVVSWTVIRVPPGDFGEQAPYPVVLVALEDGKRVSLQLVDWEQSHLRKGQPVVAVARCVIRSSQDGVIPYGIKAKPVE